MALRIRKDGRILCAALNKEEEGDLYIDDDHHYTLTAEMKIIVTEPEPKHTKKGGVWWWKNQVPTGVSIDKFYLY